MDGQGFTFRQFEVCQDMCAMKVGTDGVLLGAWAAGGRHILDIGTGTGLIALMMAQRFEGARICGIDMDDGACRQAMANVAGSPFAARIEICHSRLQDFSPSVTFDSIVSNPPFFTNSLKCPDARRSAARHADTLPFADLFRGVARLLDSDGVFSAVIPADAEGDFCAEAIFPDLSRCGAVWSEPLRARLPNVYFCRSQGTGRARARLRKWPCSTVTETSRSGTEGLRTIFI